MTTSFHITPNNLKRHTQNRHLKKKLTQRSNCLMKVRRTQYSMQLPILKHTGRDFIRDTSGRTSLSWREYIIKLAMAYHKEGTAHIYATFRQHAINRHREEI